MPDQPFLDLLHDDPPSVRPDLLPHELRDSYAALLDACAEAREERPAGVSAARVRRRLQPKPARDRLVKAAWLLTAAATLAAILLAVYAPRRASPPVVEHLADAPPLTLPVADPKPKEGKDEDGTATIHVSAHGQVLVRSGEKLEVVSLDGLGKWLAGAATAYDDERRRAGKGSGFDKLRASRLFALIRADRDTPWQHVQWLLIVLAEQGLHKVRFAVMQPDGREAFLEAPLPLDRGLIATRSEIKVQIHVVARQEKERRWGPPGREVAVMMPSVVKYRFAERESARVEDAAKWIREALKATRKVPDLRVVGEIKAGHKVPFRFIVGLLRKYQEAKVEMVHFYGTAVPDKELRKLDVLPFPKVNYSRAR